MTSTAETQVGKATLVDQVQHVSAAVSVRDLDASIKWYGEHLGFEVVVAQDFPAVSARLAFLRSGNVFIELVQSTPAVAITRPAPPLNYVVIGYAQISLYVADVEVARQLAQEQGLPIVTEITSVPDLGVAAFFTQDPDGNLIEIIHCDWATAGDHA